MQFKSAKGALAFAVLGTAVALSVPAFAGECPADQVATGARMSGETMPVGVTDDVIASIDLSSKGKAFEGYMMRMRRLVVQPGGVVPWHEHNARAANIYILSGAITEFRSTCKVGIEHKAGDVTAEFGEGLAHWWKNETGQPTVIISADLLPPQMTDAESM
ncbi:MAG: cupin domain-containing protein [Pseudomonadota bacterium]|nr:cupin domain-containing protein [Pseudomonadota bacterium]